MSYKKRDGIVNKILGNKIREKREAMGLTMKDIANAIGAASETTYSNWEYGKHNISLDSLYQVCAVLNCHPSDVLPSYLEFKPKLKLK